MGRLSRITSANTSKGGVVGVVSGEVPRSIAFEGALHALKAPAGTIYSRIAGPDIAVGRNNLVRTLLASDLEWLWFVDDDMNFDPDVLHTLLKHGVDLIQGLALSRTPPFTPIMYRHDLETKLYEPVLLADTMHSLVTVDACGTGGLLVRRKVFEALSDPWFEVGQIHSASLGEDLYFCQKARAAGFTVNVATNAPLGHQTSLELWPFQRDNDPWMTMLRFGQHLIGVPAASAPDVAPPSTDTTGMPTVTAAETSPTSVSPAGPG